MLRHPLCFVMLQLIGIVFILQSSPVMANAQSLQLLLIGGFSPCCRASCLLGTANCGKIEVISQVRLVYTSFAGFLCGAK